MELEASPRFRRSPACVTREGMAVPESLYYYALGEYRAVLTVTMPQTPCSWEASGGRRFWTKITEFRVSCRTKGVKCAQSESTRFERPVPRGLLPEGLPRPRAGVLVPVLPGGAYWGEALERLVPVWGNPQLECMLVSRVPRRRVQLACEDRRRFRRRAIGSPWDPAHSTGSRRRPRCLVAAETPLYRQPAAVSRSRLKGSRTSRVYTSA